MNDVRQRRMATVKETEEETGGGGEFHGERRDGGCGLLGFFVWTSEYRFD